MSLLFFFTTRFQSVSFVEVSKGQGQFQWVDTNHNGVVDLKNVHEFQPVQNGNYQKTDVFQLLGSLQFGITFWICIGLGLLFMVGRDFFYIVRIRQLTDNELSWKRSTIVILLWEYASALSPGTVGGSAIAMFILQKEGLALGRSTALVIVTALMDNLFFLLVVPLVFFFASWAGLTITDSLVDSTIMTAFWVGYGLIAIVCSFLFVSVFLIPGLPKRVFSFVFQFKWIRRWKQAALQVGDDLQLTSKTMRTKPFRFWFKVFGSTIASWTSRFLVINAVIAAFVQIGFEGHLFVLAKQFILWLLMLVSPTPGASGVAEFAFGELMAGLGSTTLIIITAAITWRLISYFPYLIIGSLLLPWWLKRQT